jgi:6-pyruvoyltetrahydropterin/6-carboxytetrahydropterin synthase
MTSLTRRYHFSASHRLNVEELSEAENVALFGKCNNPYGHGHNYVLSVTVEGPVDVETGLIVNVGTLDHMIEAVILRAFSHRNLNSDLACFANIVPTTENVVQAIAGLLDRKWDAWFEGVPGARLAVIHVQETERNGFEMVMKAPGNRRVFPLRAESITINA